MTRESEATLLDFCARQRDCFETEAWLSAPHPDREEFLCAVLFLAGVDWYSHRSSLLAIAETLEPGSIGSLGQRVCRTDFDLSRFSNLLRRKLQHASVVPAP